MEIKYEWKYTLHKWAVCRSVISIVAIITDMLSKYLLSFRMHFKYKRGNASISTHHCIFHFIFTSFHFTIDFMYITQSLSIDNTRFKMKVWDLLTSYKLLNQPIQYLKIYLLNFDMCNYTKNNKDILLRV